MKLTSLNNKPLARTLVPFTYHKCQAVHSGDIPCNERGYPMVLHVSANVTMIVWLCQDCAEQVNIDREREHA